MIKCKNCGNKVSEYRGEWWHVSECGVGDGKGKGFPEISLRKLGYISSSFETCQSCGAEKSVVKYCEKPEPCEV